MSSSIGIIFVCPIIPKGFYDEDIFVQEFLLVVQVPRLSLFFDYIGKCTHYSAL